MDGKQIGIAITTVLAFLVSNGIQWKRNVIITEQSEQIREWKDTYKKRAHRYKAKASELEALATQENLDFIRGEVRDCLLAKMQGEQPE